METPARPPADDANARITELESRLHAAETELDQFAYIVSHDLQAPLRTLQSFSHLLRGECADVLNEDAAQYLDFMESAARQIQVLLQALLQYSRARRLQDVDATVDLDEVWQQARASCAEDVRARILPERPGLGCVQGNREALISVFTQVLANALANADPERPCEIFVQSEPAPAGLRGVRIADNGRGIPDNLIEAAFEVFRKVHATSRETAGMGLAICRELIQRQGGEIRAEANPTHGLSILIQLPAAP